MLLDCNQHDYVAVLQRRHEHRYPHQQSHDLRYDHGNNTAWLRHRNVEIGTGYLVGVASNLRELVAPSGIPNPTVDCLVYFLCRGLRVRATLSHDLVDELSSAPLHQLSNSVKHLTAVVGGCTRPAAERGAGRHHGIPGVLSRSLRRVSQKDSLS